MSIFQSTRAEKAAKQLATNIEKLDALAAAQALLAKVQLNIQTRRSDLDRLDAELGELAIRKADGEDIDAGAKQPFDMHGTDESGADNRSGDFFHEVVFLQCSGEQRGEVSAVAREGILTIFSPVGHEQMGSLS